MKSAKFCDLFILHFLSSCVFLSIPMGTFWKSALKLHLAGCGNSEWTDRVANTGIKLKEKRSAAIKNKF